MSERSVWTVGHLTVDDVVTWDGTVHFESAGGAALYAAVGASLIGIDACIATRLGTGYRLLEIQRLGEFGIKLFSTAGKERSISQWALYEKDGSRTYVLHPDSGSLDKMSPTPADYQIPSSAAIHLAPMPLANQLEWCRSMRGRNSLLTVDPHAESCQNDPGGVLEMIPYVNAFLPSQLESSALAGDDPVVAVRKFQAAGAPIAVVKLGGGGSIVGTGDGIWHIPAIPVDVVDVTGAGDAYCGAFVGALCTGLDGLAAACLATAAASAVVEVCATGILSFSKTRRQVIERARSIKPIALTRESWSAQPRPINRRTS